ncbi:MAG: sugar phosphate isomerase/epimerase family protein, partial [Candidatus Hydrogenedentes bacterium]|nr:sugar phosphate isomerase/epimerase family protein [Candidatus Hydrogenedentota bacterium]
MLKKGIRDGCFGASLTLEEEFELGAATGFQGIEITFPEDGEYSLSSPDSKLLEIKGMSESFGLELHSMGGGTPWNYPLTAADKAVREQGMAHMRRTIDIAANLGIDSMLTITARVEEGVSYKDAWNVSQAALRELAPRAADKGVHLLIENVWNNFLYSPMEMARYIDEAESDYVGAYFDVGNVVAFAYPEHWIEILGSRIGKVHIKDYIRARKNMDGFCPLLEGDVDWKVVMPALKSVGYDDWATLEVNAYSAYPEQGVA